MAVSRPTSKSQPAKSAFQCRKRRKMPWHTQPSLPNSLDIVCEEMLKSIQGIERQAK